MKAGTAFRHTRTIVALSIALAAFVLYLPSLQSGFVYDAQVQIGNDNYIHTPSHLADVLTLRVLGQDVLDGTRPAHLLVYLLESLVWGRLPFGYHLTSILLHAVIVAFVFLLLENFGRKIAPDLPSAYLLWSAGIAALFFCVHPVLTEAVAEPSYREDLLSTFFLLLALILAAEFPDRTRRRTMLRGTACVAALGMAAASKETGFAGPILLALCGWLFHRHDRRTPWVALCAVSALVVGSFAIAYFTLEPKNSIIFTSKPLYLGGSLAATLFIQPRIWTFLLTNIGWPAHLSADYQPQNIIWITLPAAIAVLALFLGLQTFLAVKSRLALLGAVIFWMGLAPVSNLIPIYRPVADRFLYLPMTGLAATLCAAFLLAARRKVIFVSLVGATCAVSIACVPGTWQRQAVFANSLNLWRDTIAKSPTSVTAADNLGYALYTAGDSAAALPYFNRALQLTKGTYADAWAGAALALERLGQNSKAENALSNAISVDPRYAQPHKLVDALALEAAQSVQLEKILARIHSPTSPERGPTPP